MSLDSESTGSTKRRDSINRTIFRVAVLSVVKHDYVARGVASHPRFELVVVADDPGVPDWVHERNQLFAVEWKIPYVRNVEQALLDHRIDVVVVSTEAERHCDLSIRAAQMGIHVVQDKPMSNRLSECDRLVEAVRKSGVRFMMWSRNMLPAIQHATELVRAGQIGIPISMHVDFYFSKDAGPPKGSRKPGEPPIAWLDFQRAAHADGSDGAVGTQPLGELQNEGVYALAFIQQVTGCEFQRVYARSATAFHQVNVDNDVEDFATATLELSSGMIATMAVGRIGAASHPDIGEIKLSITGTEGALVVAEARPEVGIYYRGQPAKEFRHQRVGSDNDFLLMDNFARSIDEGSPTLLDEHRSRMITATVQAALRSAKTGRFEVVE
ncbi:MAG: Gfo/Idh/MocA family oxidoreductase [Pirellula sp.]